MSHINKIDESNGGFRYKPFFRIIYLTLTMISHGNDNLPIRHCVDMRYARLRVRVPALRHSPCVMCQPSISIEFALDKCQFCFKQLFKLQWIPTKKGELFMFIIIIVFIAIVYWNNNHNSMNKSVVSSFKCKFVLNILLKHTEKYFTMTETWDTQFYTNS